MTAAVRRLSAVDEAQLAALADVLIDCVDRGASVSFMHPLTRDRAPAFWRRVADGVTAGERALLVAEDARGVCGTVQLVLAQPENQPHRADLTKMLVHRRARRHGKRRRASAGRRCSCSTRSPVATARASTSATAGRAWVTSPTTLPCPAASSAARRWYYRRLA